VILLSVVIGSIVGSSWWIWMGWIWDHMVSNVYMDLYCLLLKICY